MPAIDWTTLTNEQILDLMDEGRDEIERREEVLAKARNGSPKGPGRPRGSKNGVTQLSAADLKEADS
jgi:hypothetical protein